jgi:TonB family protein
MFLSLLAAAAVAAEPQQITHPDWRSKPSADQMAAIYPAHAAQLHIGGRAVITCVVNVNGFLEACQVDSESPPGEGFGPAALAMAPSFSMTPATGPDGPVPAKVTIPIIWNMPGGAAPIVPDNSSPYGGGSRLAPAKSRSDSDIRGNDLILHPMWTSAPTFADVAAVYPAGAAGTSGHVVLRCRVVSGGALKSCDTVAEEPAGKGFARAAYALVGHFRVSAESLPTRDGDPTFVEAPFRLIDPQSDAFKQRRIGAPTWRLALDPDKVAQVYPEEAAAKGIATGRGVAKCEVAADGALTDCQEMPGEPDGLGFSHSAVVVASAMAMNPWTDEGDPVDGSSIVLPIRFNLAPDAAPPAAK